MEWKYAIELTLNHPVRARVNVLGQEKEIRLSLNANATNPGMIEGGINFECKTPGFIEGCYCLMHNLRRQDPTVTTNLETDVYDAVDIIGGAAGFIVPQYVTFTRPTIQLTSSMQVTSQNAGKSYNVFVESNLNYTPGQVIVDPPDLENLPLPAPFDAVTVPIGPFPFSLGEAFTSVHRAEYVISCCTWDDGLPEWERRDGEPLNELDEVLVPEDIEDCGCGDYSSLHVRSGIVTANPIVNWKIKAIEGPCQWKVVLVNRDQNGTRKRKKKQEDKSEEEH